MKTINDLKLRGIHVSQTLIKMVTNEVTLRMTGIKDGILHEGLDQIIANQFTLLRYQDEDDESPEKVHDEIQQDYNDDIASGLSSEH